MAMNKAEKARMEELETALSLCWPSYPCPKPMTIEAIKSAPQVDAGKHHGQMRKAAKGYFMNSYSSLVTQGFSTGNIHSLSADGSSWMQQAGVMYETELHALMAMRHQVSRECAGKLARIDRAIAFALQERNER